MPADVESRRSAAGWRRHFFYRKEVQKTTWKFRLLAAFIVLSLIWTARGLWASRLAAGLVCREDIPPRSDALLLENFEPSYLVYVRAAALLQSGAAPDALVPVLAGTDPETPRILTRKVSEMMAQMAGLERMTVVPIVEKEPITLNAAYQIRKALQARQVKSVTIVSPDFRSRRSFVVYNSVFAPAGIRVGCVPVFGRTTPDNWTRTWHGMQAVGLQFLKLQFYRFYVRPWT
jgi:hypothetical protein